MYTFIKNTSIAIEDGDRGKNYPSSNDFFEQEHCLFLNNKNIIDNRLSLIGAQYITKEKHISLGKGAVKLNDLVLTTRGTLGHCLIFENEATLPVRINSGMVIIRPNKDYSPKFLYFYFQSDHFKNQILKMRSGSAQPQLPIKDLKNILVPKFELDIQQHIVNIIYFVLIFLLPFLLVLCFLQIK